MIDLRQCRIVITTSDDYVGLLPGFAHQWDKYCGLPVTVVYRNVAPPALPSHYTMLASPARYYDWSTSLRNALEQMTEPIVLLGLEDYWLADHVNMPALAAALTYILEHEEVQRIDLTRDRTAYPHIDRGEYVQAILNPDAVEYVLSTQFSLWQKAFLHGALQPGELGPQFEVEASRRIAPQHPIVLGTRQVVLPCHGDGVIWNGRLDNLHLEYLSDADIAALKDEGYA